MNETPAYVCEYCTAEYSSASAQIACEITCANDRGRD